MKKVLLLSAICALLAASCTKQETGGWKPGTVQFVITAGADTRAGIYSEETIDPSIDNVNVYVFLENVYDQTIAITGWNSGAPFTLEGDNTLPAGNYKFLAVGRIASDGYEFPADWTGLTFDEAIVSLTTANVVGDIYAGTDVEALTDAGGRVEIDMTRKVAGLLGYFVNIPATVDGKTIGYMRLTMSTTNTAVSLTDGTGSVPGGATFDIIEFDFTGQAAVDGIYPGNAPIAGVTQLPDSYIDGSFLIPVEATFTLGLYDADISNTDPVHTWTVNGGNPIKIDANYLYTIGRKKMAGNTNGGTDDDPTPTPGDDDQAFDLMSSQELTISISPEWLDIIPIEVI